MVALFAAAMASFVTQAALKVESASDHPAARKAAELISKAAQSEEESGRTSAFPAVVRLSVTRSDGDGYKAARLGDTVTIEGARPRSLLFAAGEAHRWLALKPGESLRREPKFALRSLNFTGNGHDVAEWVAAAGVNMIQLGRNAPVRMVDDCKAADVEVFAFLYGCDPMKWGRERCEAFLAEHPTAKGVDPGRSWEKGLMCPSDPATWDFFTLVITNLAMKADYDGVSVTFWDDYGLNCHCKRCRKSGRDKFGSQVASVVKCFEKALKPLGKKLLVRTWSSGAPHFLGDEWVHAPGYGGSGGQPLELWGETYRSASRDTIFQTKVYNADCQPNPPFSLLLGKACDAGFTELAEWQITGQTVGLGYLPASVVDHTSWTMKKAFELTRGKGVCLYAGGYNNPDYEALDDILNSINIYAWRQLSWDPEEDVSRLWQEWAAPRFGAAAPAMVEALRRSEMASVVVFSPLGFGTATESRFDSNVSRREDHIRYTNRHYLPEGQTLLEPTKENIAHVVEEKDTAIASVDEMLGFIDSGAAAWAEANGGAVPPWREEAHIRTEWLRACLVVSRALDGAYWRFRYLRQLSQQGMADFDVLNGVDEDFETVRQNHRELFKHDDDLRLSFYGMKPCGDRDISLRSPLPLMRDIHSNAVECVEHIMGPIRKAR